MSINTLAILKIYNYNSPPNLDTYLLASSSRTLASNSLLGGYFGKLEGSHGRGFIEKNYIASKTKGDNHQQCTLKLANNTTTNKAVQNFSRS